MSDGVGPTFEDAVAAFERAWRRGDRPDIRDFVPSAGPARARLLPELVCVDLEYRWRGRGGSTGPLLDEYVREFPELGPLAGLDEELAAEEYRARHRWGDRPEHREFRRRFGPRPGLSELLRRVDEELRDETADETASRTTNEPRASIPYGNLLLRRMVGSGGFGKVYVADRKGVEGPVAVKFLRKTFWRRPEAVDRFLAEAETVARLRNDGIVAVHGAGLTPAGGPFLVMDLVDGPDLEKQLRAGPVAVGDAVRWTAEACRAVAHAHGHGVIHCDLKPANLLLGPDGRVRVTDFGLAKSADAELSYGGTVGFMAPEQLDAGLGEVGPATDIYGLGATLFALLTGSPPWPAASIEQPLASAGVPDDVIEVCRRCLNSIPSRRYADAGSLLKVLVVARPGEVHATGSGTPL